MPRQRVPSFLVTAALLAFSQHLAHAQGSPGPRYMIAEKLDEWRLQRDQAQLQHDLERGDSARVNRDLNRIEMDQWWIGIDRRGGWSNLPLPQPITPGATLIPHPQYPGYGYYPANPTQLYQLKRPGPGSNPAPAGMAAASSAVGSTPGARTSPARVSVVILNSERSGGPVNYVVDRVTYKTDSGRLQRLAVGPSSSIAFDRGGDFGVQRYALSAGVYEFRTSDRGWALFKVDSAPREESSEPLPALPGPATPARTASPDPGESGARRPTPHG